MCSLCTSPQFWNAHLEVETNESSVLEERKTKRKGVGNLGRAKAKALKTTVSLISKREVALIFSKRCFHDTIVEARLADKKHLEMIENEVGCSTVPARSRFPETKGNHSHWSGSTESRELAGCGCGHGVVLEGRSQTSDGQSAWSEWKELRGRSNWPRWLKTVVRTFLFLLI